MADVFRRFGPAFRERHGASLSVARWRAMTAIETCRTAALGGHVESCGDCGHQRVSYNSCRNRNCPKCQGLARAQWLEDRQAELLDVPYFHVVFTVPDLIATIAFQNQTVVYDILFRAASETLRTIAADPAHLGAEIGFLGVLHSWGQNLLHHPHIHFLVPGGGIAPNGKSWIACRPGFDTGRHELPNQLHLIGPPRCRPEVDEGDAIEADGHLPLVGPHLRGMHRDGFPLAAKNLYRENIVCVAKADSFVSVVHDLPSPPSAVRLA